MQPKILFIDRRFTPTGGAQLYLDQLVMECVKSGYQAELVVNSHANLKANYHLLRNAGVAVHAVPFAGQPANVLAKRLTEFFAESDPDLIHVNTSCRELRQILVKVKDWPKMRCKRIFTMHLSVLSEKSTGKRFWPWSYAASTRDERRKFMDIFDHCITVSNENGKKASQLLNLPQDLFTFIPNGVDVSKFAPKQNSSPTSGQFVVGCCARLSEQKRLDILIRAIAKLAARNNVLLKLAGDGPERERLEALVVELGIADRVEFLGTQNDVCSFLHSLDLFAMTSDREGLPYALLEAMATGLPTIVTGVNDMPVVVRDGVDGFVIPKGNINACTEKIQTLISAPEMRSRFGVSARRRVCEGYSAESCLKKTLAVFESAISDRTELDCVPHECWEKQ